MKRLNSFKHGLASSSSQHRSTRFSKGSQTLDPAMLDIEPTLTIRFNRLEDWYLFEGTHASAMSMRSSYAKNLAISCQNNDKWNQEECHGYYQTCHTSL